MINFFKDSITVIGGITGVGVIIAIIANSTQIIEWLSKKFSKKNNLNNGEDQNAEETISYISNNMPSSNILIGRKKLVHKLRSSIDKNPLTLIIGPGGIGKSSLAIETVKKYYLNKHSNKKHSHFDAVIWISAKDENINFSKFLDIIARVLGYTGVLQITDIELKEMEVEQLFRKNKILLIIDNFETIHDDFIVKFVEKVSDNDRVIITSRERRNWNITHTVVYVDALQLKDGLSLIKHEYKKQGFCFNLDETYDLESLFYAAAGYPLAIKWAIGQVGTKGIPLERIIFLLQNGEGDIFEKMFSASWDSLDDKSKKILFILLFFSPAASRNALSSATKYEDNIFDMCIGELISLSLVEISDVSTVNQKFSLHPLTRSFVEKKHVLAKEDDKFLHENLLVYYIEMCQVNENWSTIRLYDEIETEITNIFKIIEWAKKYNDEYSDLICKIIDRLSVFLWSRGYWTNRINLSELGVTLSLKKSDYQYAIIHQYYIGIVQFWQGNFAGAKNSVLKCNEYLSYCDDKICKALVTRLNALNGMNDNHLEKSVSEFKTVLSILEKANPEDIKIFADWRVDSEFGFKAGIVAIYQEIGITYNRNKKYNDAIMWLEQSLTLAIEIEDTEGQAISLSHLGFSYVGIGDLIKAESYCKKGLEYALLVNRKSTIGRCYQVLAEVKFLKKKYIKAKKYAESALVWFEKLGMNEEQEAIKKYL